MIWTGFGELQSYLDLRQTEFDQIPEERKAALDRLAGDIQSALTGEGPVRIIFICTHNSRRSQMCQLWAQVGAGYYGVTGVSFYSGGTQTTAFHPLAVKAVKEAGFRITTGIPGSNPVYRVSFPGSSGEDRVFSKKYFDPPNPVKDFIAVMTCSDADDACPVVYGATARHTIRYDDPKAFEGTPDEREGYAKRSRQIAREMLYLLSGNGLQGDIGSV